MLKNSVHIIGVFAGGSDGFSPAARRILRKAEIIYGGKRLLAMLPFVTGQKVPITDNLSEVSDSIKSNLGRKKMAVLASGDPNFYGIAAYLSRALGRETLEIIPNVSSMQLAFARIKESWEDAVFISVHGRPLAGLVDLVRVHNKVCILTDARHTPAVIAGELRRVGINDFQAYVCQDLGSKSEAIIRGDLKSIEACEFSPLNIMILIRHPLKSETDLDCHSALDPVSGPPHQEVSSAYSGTSDTMTQISEQVLGIPEDRFKLRSAEHSLITKLEVRAVSLAKLGLNDHSVMWDIGAGSGSVSIEASMLAHRGQVWAIEKNEADVQVIRENILRFNRTNIRVVQAAAPFGLDNLPDPSAVFIGGSGGHMPAILALICKRLQAGGRIVINAVTLENLQIACAGLTAHRFEYETVLLNISRSKTILDLTRLEALNPVFVITGWRPPEKDYL